MHGVARMDGAVARSVREWLRQPKLWYQVRILLKEISTLAKWNHIILVVIEDGSERTFPVAAIHKAHRYHLWGHCCQRKPKLQLAYSVAAVLACVLVWR